MNELFLRNQLCIPVQGYNRAIIYDILRKDYFFIPKEYYPILNTDDFIKFAKLNADEDRDDLVSFLKEEEMIFEIHDTEQKECFTVLDRNLYNPNQLTNIVIYSNIDFAFFDLIDDQYLMNLSIIAPQIDTDLLKLVEKINSLEVDNVYLYILDFNEAQLDEYVEILSSQQLIFSVNFFGASVVVHKTKMLNNIYFNFFEENFNDYKRKLTTDKLVVNNDHFLEAYNYHSYYFGKVHIDEVGNIKNGLNNKESFGNIASITKEHFFDIIASTSFREVGNIKKDNTLVCQDCEFRYMCLDSRVPIRGDTEWYHETECVYNPYLSKWNHETGYLNLIDSGVTVSSTGSTVDVGKLSLEFEKAWSF